MNVKLIRMWSGEDVVADLVKETDDSITISNAIVAVPSGNGNLAFAPWSPLLGGRDVDLEVTKKYVIYINVPQQGIIDQYNEMYASLETPPTKKLIL